MSSDAPKIKNRRLRLLLVAAIVFVAAWYGVPPVHTAVAVRMMPAPAEKTIDPELDVLPILEGRCSKCHGGGRHRGGFQFDTREFLLKGGESGPAIAVGDSMNSRLIHRVAGVPYVQSMPPRGNPKLSDEQVGLLRAWIDQGLEWVEEDESAD